MNFYKSETEKNDQVSDHAILLQTGSSNNGATLPTASSSCSLNSETAVVDVITQVGATFTKLIELMLSKEIKVSGLSLVN